MAYYININGRVEEVSEQAYRAFNLGTPGNPAASGTELQLNNQQQILNPNTTDNIPGNKLPSLSEQIAAAGLSPPPSQLSAQEQATIDSLNRIEANRAQPGSDGSLPTQADFAALRQAQIDRNGGVDPNAVSPEVQAQLDQINARAPGPQSFSLPTEADFAALRAAQTNPTPFDPNQDEFGNLGAAQAAAAERAPETLSPDAVQAGLDDAFANKSVEPDRPPEAYDAKSLGIEQDSWLSQRFGEAKSFVNRATLAAEEAFAGSSQAATINKAKEQATLAARYKSPANADWRVRLILPENANYLYKANPPGILKPLAQSNGVVFPYTPNIQTNYSANYEQYDLVHSNYRGYFYKNSKVGDISVNAVFTAQDTQEAEYLLAVIHFFRSATKMFYGQDAQRGAPPPMVYLVGLGDYQFNGHPCLISNFQYNLPADVDYIRANNPNNYGTNMLNRVSASTSTSNIVPASVNRLANAIDNFGRSLQLGALSSTPTPGTVPGSVSNLNRSTYVPTKMEISLTLLPVQTRAQVSKQFSVKGFANGDLLKGGFW